MAQSLYRQASLIMNPYGAKDDLLPSIKPTDGSGDFTFSRDGAGASPATRVNASGLIEKGRENLLLQSNTFDTTWTNVNTTETSGQSGYDGSNDAWLLDRASVGSGRIQQGTFSAGVYTFSVYTKAGTSSWVQLYMDNTTGAGDPTAYFNLTGSGAVGTTSNNIDAQIVSVGGGWFRCSVTGNVAGTFNTLIFPADGDGDVTSTAGNIYIQDAQLEQGLVATDYIETTTAPVSAGLLGDMPRLDYSGGATCPSLLLEPSRVNLVTQSEYLNGITSAGGTITDNATTSPEGVVNAGLYTENTANTYHRFNTGNQTYTQNQSYTFSVFAKAQSGSRYVIVNCASAFNARAFFDIDNGTYTTNAGTADIQDYGNGWYRCIVTGTRTAATGTDSIYFGLNTTQADSAYTGDGTSGAYFWGAQLESGSYPTSYIPTYGSASTMAADDCVKTGISSLIGQTEGTLFFDFYAYKNSVGNDFWFNVSDALSNEWVFIGIDGNNYRFYLKANSVVVFSETATINEGRNKMAISYQSGSTKLILNGVVLQTKTDAFSFATALDLCYFQNSNKGNAYQALVFKTALTDAECISLTTI